MRNVVAICNKMASAKFSDRALRSQLAEHVLARLHTGAHTRMRAGAEAHARVRARARAWARGARMRMRTHTHAHVHARQCALPAHAHVRARLLTRRVTGPGLAACWCEW